MLKVRAMGSREEIRWFQELLANSQTIELMDFSEIMLQRNYASIASQFGESEKTVTRAIVVLEKLGVVKRHRKTIQMKGGLIVNNVLFLELQPERLYELTYPSVEMLDERINDQNFTEWTEMSGGLDKSVRTNTKNTTENTTESPSIYLAGNDNEHKQKQEQKQPDTMDEIEAYTSLIRGNLSYDIHMNCENYFDREIFHDLYG